MPKQGRSGHAAAYERRSAPPFLGWGRYGMMRLPAAERRAPVPPLPWRVVGYPTGGINDAEVVA